MFKLLYPNFWQSKNIVAYLLWIFSQIYLLISYLRLVFSKKPVIFPAKVICIGNVTVGGTGKTQLVIYLAKLLSKKNIRFVMITKAYNSKLRTTTLVKSYHTSEEVGDESLLLAKYGLVIATKKIPQALELINSLKPEIIIVDDSLQNPNFHKDYIFLCIDAHRMLGNGFLIPAGPLREYPGNALKAADLILLVHSNKINELIIPDCLKIFSSKLLSAQIVVRNEIDKSSRYFAFSGIGNPQKFLITLKEYGLNIIDYKIFPDHYNYLPKDLELLCLRAKEHDAILITTRKDYIKLYSISSYYKKVICVDVELRIEERQNLIYETIFKKH